VPGGRFKRTSRARERVSSNWIWRSNADNKELYQIVIRTLNENKKRLDGELTKLYAKGKTNESQYKILKDKISDHTD